MSMYLTWCHGRRVSPSPVGVGQDLRVDIVFASLLHTLDLLEREKAVVDRSSERTTAGGRAADGASGRGERGSRGEAVEVGTHKSSVKGHESRRALLHDDGGLHVGWLGRGNVDCTAEGICSGHLVHVQHGLGSVHGLLLGHAVLWLLVLRVGWHLSIELLHVGWMASEVGWLSLLRCGIRSGIVCK